MYTANGKTSIVVLQKCVADANGCDDMVTIRLRETAAELHWTGTGYGVRKTETVIETAETRARNQHS